MPVSLRVMHVFRIANTPPLLMVGRGETHAVSLLEFDAESAALTNGVYGLHAVTGDGAAAESDKHGKKLTVYGTAEGLCTATLTITMDGARSSSFPVRGAYDANMKKLFYIEFEPSEITGRQFDLTLSDIEGVGVRIESSRLDFTLID
jgi:hypothetical protein